MRCPNRSCPAQIVESIKHFVSKRRHGHRRRRRGGGRRPARRGPRRQRRRPLRPQARRLRRLRPSVDVPASARKSARADGAEIVVPKRAEKVLAAIEASKQQPFARVLFALGIRHVGASRPRCWWSTSRAGRAAGGRGRGDRRGARHRSGRRRGGRAVPGRRAQPRDARQAAGRRPALRRGGPAQRRPGRSPARPSCSPASCRRSLAARRGRLIEAAGGQVSSSVSGPPTTSWPARTPARSSPRPKARRRRSSTRPACADCSAGAVGRRPTQGSFRCPDLSVTSHDVGTSECTIKTVVKPTSIRDDLATGAFGLRRFTAVNIWLTKSSQYTASSVRPAPLPISEKPAASASAGTSYLHWSAPAPGGPRSGGRRGRSPPKAARLAGLRPHARRRGSSTPRIRVFALTSAATAASHGYARLHTGATFPGQNCGWLLSLASDRPPFKGFPKPLLEAPVPAGPRPLRRLASRRCRPRLRRHAVSLPKDPPLTADFAGL